jgi:hypothetical protein
LSRIGWKHGFWNTLEHGVTRGADAATSIVLLWALPSEIFSKLAIAQAVVAPLLVLFVSPTWALYRDFNRWRGDGASALAARLHALRLYGRGLGQLALVLALSVALIVHGEGPFLQRFAAMVWAFALLTGVHLCSADREFLRLELKLTELNTSTLIQKFIVFFGSLVVALRYPERLDFLALVAVFSMVVSAIWTEAKVKSLLRDQGATPASIAGREGPPVFVTLEESIRHVSIWNHLSGVALNWVQTMDVFFLGMFRFPAMQVGLYAAALKLSNVTFALPGALASLFSVWVGRQHGDEWRERPQVWRLSGFLFLGSVVQAGLLAALGPWIISALSRGRWSPGEQREMLAWMRWILAGSAIYCSTILFTSWLTIRAQPRSLFFRVYLPWLGLSLAAYGFAAHTGGPDRVAPVNIVVAVLLVGLLAAMNRRQRFERDGVATAR